MTGSQLLKKLSVLCYTLGIIGIIIGIVAMSTRLGETLFNGYIRIINIPNETNLDAKVYAGINLIVSSSFTLFEGWLLGRAVKNGRKTIFLIILLILGIISPIMQIIYAGFNSILNTESISNIIEILIKTFILTQVIKVRREAIDE